MAFFYLLFLLLLYLIVTSPYYNIFVPSHFGGLIDHEDDKTSLITDLLYAYQTMSPIYTVMICGATFIWRRFRLSKVYNEPFIGLSTRKTAVNTLEPAPPRDFYISGRDSGRYQHVSYVIWRRIKQAEDENGVVKQRFPGKAAFEQSLCLGEDGSRHEEQKTQRPEVGDFTQNIYDVGESWFSDI